MANEMEYWEPIDDDSWEDDQGIEDILSADLLGIAEQTKRSLDEILDLEIELIQENTELEPELWIQIYAERYRDIMERDSSGTKSQIKRRLYFQE